MSSLSEDEEESLDEEDSEEEDSEGEESEGESDAGSGSSEEEIFNEEVSREKDDLPAKGIQQMDVSSSSEEGSERERCPVCLNRFIGQDLGIPENCEHIFCLECIKEWSTNINTCPIDRNEFNFLYLKRKPDGKVLKKIRVRVRAKEPEEGGPVEESTLCEVCRNGDREDRLLLCDACDLAYHCDCLDPPLFYIPIEEWFCPPCSSVMTSLGSSGAMATAVRSRRVIPRTRASEAVRVRVQNRRTSKSSSNSTPRPKKRKRRTYRRCIRKVVNLARTKGAQGGGKGGKVERATAVMVTYARKRYRRRKKRKTKKSTRPSSRTAEASVQSAKERISKRLGLVKAKTGVAIPAIKANPGSSKGSFSDRNHSLFGKRDQLMDFSENFNDDQAGPSTSANRNFLAKPEMSATSTNLLDSILAGQKILHTKSDNVVIRTDGSLILKEDTKKKSSKSNDSAKSALRIGLYKQDVTTKSVDAESVEGSSSFLHDALTKKFPDSCSRSRRSSEHGLSSKPNKRSEKVLLGAGCSTSESGTSSVSHYTVTKHSDYSSKHRNSKSNTIGSADIDCKRSHEANKKVEKSTVSKDNQPEKSSSTSRKRSDSNSKPHQSKRYGPFDFSDIVPNNSCSTSKKENSLCIFKNAHRNTSSKKVPDLHSKHPKTKSSPSHYCSDDFSKKIKKEKLIKIEDISPCIPNQIYPRKNSIDGVSKHQQSLFENTHEASAFNVQNSILDHRLEVLQKRALFLKKFDANNTESEVTKELSSDLTPSNDRLPGLIENIKVERQIDKSQSLKCGAHEVVQAEKVNCKPIHEESGKNVRFKKESSLEGSSLPVGDHNSDSSLNLLETSKSILISGTSQPIEFKIKEEPCSTDDDEEIQSESLIGQLGQDKISPKILSTNSNSLIEQSNGISSDNLDSLAIRGLSEKGDIKNIFIKEEPISSDEDTSSHTRNHPLTSLKTRVKVDPDASENSDMDETQTLQASQLAFQSSKYLPCIPATQPFEDLPCTQVDFSNDVNCSSRSIEQLSCTEAAETVEDLPSTQAAETWEDLPCTQAAETFENLPFTQAAGFFSCLPPTQTEEYFNNLPPTQAAEFCNDLPPTQAAEFCNDLPPTQAAECFDDLPPTQAAEFFDDLPPTQAAVSFDNLSNPHIVRSFDDLSCTQKAGSVKDLLCTQAKRSFENLPNRQVAGFFDDLTSTQVEDLSCTQAEDSFEDLPCTQAAESFKGLPCTQVDDLPFAEAEESFGDLPCTQAEKSFKYLPCTQVDNLPFTEAEESFEDLSCTQVDYLSCTQAEEPFEDLPCTQVAKSFKDLPCTQVDDLSFAEAEESFEDLPCTQAAESFKDLPCTQVDDLPFTEAEESFEDLPCTQAAESFKDLPCTQVDDLPCTESEQSFEDLSCTQVDYLSCTQAEEPFEDLPCTQTEEAPFNNFACPKPIVSISKTGNEKTILQKNSHKLQVCRSSTRAEVSSNKLPSIESTVPLVNQESKLAVSGNLKRVPNKPVHSMQQGSGGLIEDSNLPATQIFHNKISSSDSNSSYKNLPQKEKEDCKTTDLDTKDVKFDIKLLSNPELDIKQAVALLRNEKIVKAKNSPKVVGVHRNLPQVLTSVPVRRQLTPKPVNKRTFSFEQVKQNVKLEELPKKDVCDVEVSSNASCTSIDKSILKSECRGAPFAQSNLVSHSAFESLPNGISTKTTKTLPKSYSDASSHEYTSKDCKNQASCKGILAADSNFAKSSLKNKTFEDVSSIQVNDLNKPSQSSSLTREVTYMPNNTLQTESIPIQCIKKEPFDSVDSFCESPSSCGLVGESNMERALRIKREMNAVVLQQSATYKERLEHEIHSFTQDSNILWGAKQELNLKAEPECDFEDTFLGESSVHVKLEKVKDIESSDIGKQDRCKSLSVHYIKKEPGCHTASNKSESHPLTAKKSKEKKKEEKTKESKSTGKDKEAESKKHDDSREQYQHEKSRLNYEENSYDTQNKHVEKVSGSRGRSSERKISLEEKAEGKGMSSSIKNKNADKSKDDIKKEGDSGKSNKYAKKNRDSEKEGSERKSRLVEVDEQGKKEKNYDHQNKQVVKSHCKEKNSEKKNKSLEKDKSRDRYPDREDRHTEKDNYANEENNSIKNSKHLNTKYDSKDSSVSKNKLVENENCKLREKSKKNAHGERDKSDRKEKDKRLETNKHSEKSEHLEKNNHLGKDKYLKKDKHIEKDKHAEKVKHPVKDKYSEKDRQREKDNQRKKDDHQEKDKQREKDNHRKKDDHQEKDKQKEKDNHREKDDHQEKDKQKEKDNHREKDKQKEKEDRKKDKNVANDKQREKNHREKGKYVTNDKHDNSYNKIKHGEKDKNSANVEKDRLSKPVHNIKKTKELHEKHSKESTLSESSVEGKKTLSSGEKRSLENSSSSKSNEQQDNKKQKMSEEVDKQSSSLKYKSPDSTSGPDGNTKFSKPSLDSRGRKNKASDDCDTRASKKQNRESICSDDIAFSDVSQLSNDVNPERGIGLVEVKKEQKPLIADTKNLVKVERRSGDLKEEIASEVKEVLKPFFTVGVIDKDDYKDIMRRAVPKVFLNCGNSINPEKIKKLVLGYISKLKNS